MQVNRFARGQAMTEFVIAATFVLVPLFVFVPLLGKYIDFKHATIHAARYQAWEYTVHYDNVNNRDILDNFDSGIPSYNHPQKTILATRNESQIRTMSTVGSGLPGTLANTNAAPIQGIVAADATQGYTPNALWTDHRGLSFYAAGAITPNDVQADAATPTLTILGVNVGAFLNAVIDVVQFGFGAVSAIIGFLGGAAGFSAMHTDGFSHVDFDAVATIPRGIAHVRRDLSTTAATDTSIAPMQNLAFNAKAGVLAAGWNAGGTEHTYLQVGGTTPATLVNALLNLPGLSQIWDLIAFIAPELSRCNPPGPPDPLIQSPLAAPEGHLWLGYVDGDVVHPDRLSEFGGDPTDRLGTHACDDSGRCVWNDSGWSGWAPDPPMAHSPCLP